MPTLLIVLLNCSGKEPNSSGSEQCNNAFNILKEELCKMPSLQYPNPNKLFKLFTDASNYSYSGILHQAQDKEPAQLIPMAYFSGSFNSTQQLWNITQKECYTVFKSINKFSFYLTGAECTLYCDHKLLAPFLTTGGEEQNNGQMGT